METCQETQHGTEITLEAILVTIKDHQVIILHLAEGTILVLALIKETIKAPFLKTPQVGNHKEMVLLVISVPYSKKAITAHIGKKGLKLKLLANV